MTDISFVSDKVGVLYLEKGLVMQFPGGVGTLSYPEAKKAVAHHRYGKVFKMTKYGEALFKAYQQAEKSGVSLESVSVKPEKKAAGSKRKTKKELADERKAKAEEKAATKQAKADEKAAAETKKKADEALGK